MQPEDQPPQTNPEPTVVTSEVPTSPVATPTEQTPSFPELVTPPSRKKPVLLITTLVILIVLISVGAVVLTGGKSPKKTASTLTPQTSTVSGSDAKAVVKGLQVDESLKSTYTLQSSQATDLDKIKKQLSDQGLANFLTVDGTASYGTLSQQGGNAVVVYWGTVGSDYSSASYNTKYQAFATKSYQALGAVTTFDTLPDITVKTTTNHSYNLPCMLTSITSQNIHQYVPNCQGTLGASKAFVNYSTISGTKSEAQSALNAFVAGTKIEL